MPIEGYGAAAPIYQAAGWRGVLPLPPGKKWPPPDGFTGEHGAWPKPSTIEDWCRSQPDANLGLRLPDGLFGADLDLYKEGRPERYRKLVRRIGPPPPTWRSSSREDGSGIYLYRVPLGTRLAGSLPFGLGETIQRHHRYICAWPSINPDSGARVYWWDPEGSRCETVPSDLDEIPELPEAWLEALLCPEAFDEASSNGSTANGSHPDGWSPRVTEALTEALESMTAGSRHDTTRDAVFALVRYAELGHPGADEALEQLGQVFRTSILDRSTPEEAAAEWVRMVAGARFKAAADPTTAPRYGDEGPRPEDFVGGQNHTSSETEPEPDPDVQDFLAEDEPAYDFVIPGVVERGDRVILTGVEGHGKSTLLRQIAVQAGSGIHPFTGDAMPPVKVTFIDLENSKNHTRRQLEPLVELADELGRGLVRIRVESSGIDLCNVKDREWLESRIVANEPDLVIIGPLYKMHLGDPLDEVPARMVAATLDHLRVKYAFALMIEAHSPYGTGGHQRPTRPYGASLWSRWPEFGLHLSEEGALSHWRGPRDERDWPPLLRRDGRWPWTATTDARSVLFVRIVEATREAGREVSHRDLGERLGVSHTTIRRAIASNRLVYDQLLRELQNGT